MRFQRHNLEQVEKLFPHFRDQGKMFSMLKQGRAQLEEQFAQERAQRKERREEGWGQ